MITRNAVISACEKAKQPHEAVELLAEMQQRGLELNAIPCSAAISAYEEAKRPDKALELLAGLQRRGLGPGVFAHIAALSAFRGPSSLTGSCGSLRSSSREAGSHKSRTSQPSVHVSRSSSLKGCWGS